MSFNPIRQHIRFVQGIAPVLRTRVEDENDNPVTVAAVESIAYTILNITSGANQPNLVADATELLVADVWRDSLSTLGWKGDTIGYNFQAELPAELFANDSPRSQQYLITVTGTPVSGDDFPIGVWVADVDSVSG